SSLARNSIRRCTSSGEIEDAAASRPPPSAEADVEVDGTGGVPAGGAAVPAHAASASGSRMELSLRYGIHPPGAGSAPRQGAAATARDCTPGPAFRSTRDPESLARTPAARHVAAFPDSANLPVPGFMLFRPG